MSGLHKSFLLMTFGLLLAGCGGGAAGPDSEVPIGDGGAVDTMESASSATGDGK